MPFLLGTTIWGAMIGSKNGNRFWLYGSVDGFSSSLWVAFGFWISLGGGLFTIVGLGILIWAATFLYKVIGVLVFGILVAEVVGLIAAFTNEGTSKNVLRVLWMGIGLFETLLLSGAFFLLWILRGRLNRKYRWAMSLFGTEEVSILDESAFALKAGKRLLALRKKDGKHAFFRHKTAFVVSMGVRSVRGIDATVSSSSLHAMNLAICECLEHAY